MLRVRRMDMIIRVSLSDLQRNLDDTAGSATRPMDNFAPGWRRAVDTNQAMAPLRAALIEYWLSLIRSLGTHPSTGIPLVVGEQNERLYWLVFVSSDLLGIEWTDATWNPVAGCSVVSPGCTNCYAMRLAARLDAMGL